MKVREQTQPSPAMVIAVVALAFAMAGTAVAAPEIFTGKVTKAKVKAVAKKQANKVLDARAAGLNVASAKTADNATNAQNAVNAQNGAPRAFARVISNLSGGGVDEPRSKGISDAGVTFAGGGIYCFELGFTPRSVQATVDWVGGGGNYFAHASLLGTGCPGTSDGEVRTANNAGTGINNIDFYVTFDE